MLSSKYSVKARTVIYHTVPSDKLGDKWLYRYIDYQITNTWRGDALDYGLMALENMAEYMYTTVAFQSAINSDYTIDSDVPRRYSSRDWSDAMGDAYDEYERLWGIPIGIGSYDILTVQKGAGYLDRDLPCVYLYNLAGNGRGGGTAVIEYVIKFAKSRNLPLALHSLKQSVGFYKRLGFDFVSEGRDVFMVYGGN